VLEKQPFGEVAYSYDPIGRLLEVRLDGKPVSSYEYDVRGRLETGALSIAPQILTPFLPGTPQEPSFLRPWRPLGGLPGSLRGSGYGLRWSPLRASPWGFTSSPMSWPGEFWVWSPR